MVVVLLFATWVGVADLCRSARGGRRLRPSCSPSSKGATRASVADVDPLSGPAPSGSPFLEGQTVTVAGAALLQRVATAVTKFGGNVLSSQVELEGADAKNGFVSLVASCEIEQPALQQLLYDLEAGMPFLFVDQLVAQAPAPTAATKGQRMRVLLAVSGLWPGDK